MPTWPTPGDYGNTDVVAANATVTGVFTGIRKFTVPAGVTLTVSPYDGSTGGFVDIYAREIVVAAGSVINASGSGYGGGGGAGGGAYINYPQSSGYFGFGYGGGSNGVNGTGSFSPSHPNVYAGAGGRGGGIYGGVGGAGSIMQTNPSALYTKAYAGAIGGYGSTGINGDSSTDVNVLMGSGGGGGGGGASIGDDSDFINGGPSGGGAGCCGGGIIRFFAAKITISGALLSQERTSGNGGNGRFWTDYEYSSSNDSGGGGGVYPAAGGAGTHYLGGAETNGTNVGSSASGSAQYYNLDTGVPILPGVGKDTDGNIVGLPRSRPTTTGGGGGSAAGGGILLAFNRRMAQIVCGRFLQIKATGVINNVGGIGATNGGTVKLLTPKADISGTILRGREYSPRQSGADRARVAPFGAIAG